MHALFYRKNGTVNEITITFKLAQKITKEYIPYTAKLSRGKTFAVVHKTHHSLENFRGASGPYHYVLYTANDSWGKLSRLAKTPRKLRKFSPSKVLPYTVIVHTTNRPHLSC